MTTGILGQKGGNATAPYKAIARQTRELTFDQASGAYSITGGANNWSTTFAQILFYSDSAGVWRMRYNIAGTTDSAQLIPLTIADVTFASIGANFAGCGHGTSVGAVMQNSVVANTATMYIDSRTLSTADTAWTMSGDVRLKQEPTTYTTADNLETRGLDQYFAPASSTVSGQVSTGAQGFAGVKTFDDGIKLGDGDTILTDYHEDTVNLASSGNFSAGAGMVRCVRVGKMVTITCLQEVNPHDTNTFAASAAGLIPSKYCPAAAAGGIRNVFYSSATITAGVIAYPDGHLTVTYGNSQSSTPSPPSISFSV